MLDEPPDDQQYHGTPEAMNQRVTHIERSGSALALTGLLGALGYVALAEAQPGAPGSAKGGPTREAVVNVATLHRGAGGCRSDHQPLRTGG